MASFLKCDLKAGSAVTAGRAARSCDLKNKTSRLPQGVRRALRWFDGQWTRHTTALCGQQRPFYAMNCGKLSHFTLAAPFSGILVSIKKHF
jgi:hypothetical protein